MFGHNIAKMRKEKGISQKHLAEFLHVSTSTLGMWELERREPSIDKLIAIADFFDVSVDCILRSKCEATPSVSQLTPDEHDVLLMFRKLARRNQIEAIGMLKAVLLLDNRLLDIHSDKE